MRRRVCWIGVIAATLLVGPAASLAQSIADSSDPPLLSLLPPDSADTEPQSVYAPPEPPTEQDGVNNGGVNTDVNFQKNVRLGGNKAVLLKLEVLNLFNRPTVRSRVLSNGFVLSNQRFLGDPQSLCGVVDSRSASACASCRSFNVCRFGFLGLAVCRSWLVQFLLM